MHSLGDIDQVKSEGRKCGKISNRTNTPNLSKPKLPMWFRGTRGGHTPVTAGLQKSDGSRLVLKILPNIT